MNIQKIQINPTNSNQKMHQIPNAQFTPNHAQVRSMTKYKNSYTPQAIQINSTNYTTGQKAYPNNYNQRVLNTAGGVIIKKNYHSRASTSPNIDRNYEYKITKGRKEIISSHDKENARTTHTQIDRRLDSGSARQLAKRVFTKYEGEGTGYMKPSEAAQLISDLYASINVDHPPDETEGLQFMIANDINNDKEFCMRDFEEVFVRHLSTGDFSGYRLFFEKPIHAPYPAKKSNIKGSYKSNDIIMNSGKKKNSNLKPPMKSTPKSKNPTLSKNSSLKKRAVIYSSGGSVQHIRELKGLSPEIKHKYERKLELVEKLKGKDWTLEEIERELTIAKKIFKRFDKNNRDYLEKSELPDLIKAASGDDYEPSSEEIDHYMKLMDTADENRVHIIEYEVYILESLEQREEYDDEE